MSKKIDKARDPYSFSLRGISTIASFVAPTAIEIDRLNRVREARLAESSEAASDTAEQSAGSDDKSIFGRFWLRLARRTT